MEATSQTVSFHWTCDFHFGLEDVTLTTDYVSVTRGLERQVWWSCVAQRSTMNREGILQSQKITQEVTGVMLTARKIRHYVSFLRCLLSDFPCFDGYKKDISVNFKGVYVGPSGLLSTSEWTDGQSHPIPSESSPSPSDKGYGEDMTVATEVPRIHEHLTIMGETDIQLKLSGVRQAFETLTNDVAFRNDLVVVGKLALGKLASENKKDETEFQQAFGQLLDLVSDPSCQRRMQEEIASAGLGQFSFLNLLYEFLVFGYFMKSQPFPSYCPGGFLDRLDFLLKCVMPEKTWNPTAEQFLVILQDRLLSWLEEIFSQDLPLYKNPGLLTAFVSDRFDWHVNHLLDNI